MRKFTISEQVSLAYAFLANYRSVERFPFLSQADIHAYQLQQIKQLLATAYAHTPFYRRKYQAAGLHPADIQTWEDFAQVPTITKDEVITHGLEMVDQRRRKQDLIVSRSSGSSGKFVDIYLDAQSFVTQALQVIRMLKDGYPGYGPFDKELLIYTSAYPVDSIGGLYRVIYVNNLLPVEQIFEAMIRVRPAIIAVYPSILREIAQRYGEDCLDLGLKLILTNSEHATQAERDAFATLFGCPVRDEYSSEELSSIAYQCREKRYHLVPDSSYIEILEPTRDQPAAPGQIGEIVGTCLINAAMPLIRYRQGDMAALQPGACACGKNTPHLAEFSGRTNATLYRADNSPIPSGRVLDWTYSLVLAHKLDIRELQLTQRTVTDINMILVPGPGYAPAHANDLVVRSFQATFGPEFNVTVAAAPAIARTAAGKHIPIRSLVAEQAQYDGSEGPHTAPHLRSL